MAERLGDGPLPAGPATPATHEGEAVGALGAARHGPPPPGRPVGVATGGRPGGRRAAVLEAGPLALAGLLANGASVVVTIVVARLLTTRGYGALNQLNGLFLVVSMPGSALAVAVVRRVTSWSAAGAGHGVGRWARRAHARGAVTVVGLGCGVVAAGPWLGQLLGQPHVAGLDLMLGAGAVWVLLNLDRGLLQADRRYRTLSTNLVVEGAMRTVGVLVLVGAGLGVDGAACGVLVAELVTAAHARRHAERAWRHVPEQASTAGPATDGPAAGAGRGRRTLVVDLVTALVALATIAWLQNVDVIVIGREGPSVAGPYAAVSIASKALVFAALVLGGYLLPEAAIRWHQGRHALRELGVALTLLAVPTAVLLGVAAEAPTAVLTAVFSSRYLGAESAFVPLVVAMACLGATVLCTMYLLAVGRRRVAALLVAGAVAATVAIAAAHGSAPATARADLATQVVLTGAVLAELALAHRRREGDTAGSRPVAGARRQVQ